MGLAMSLEDLAYFSRRAEQERELARSAQNPDVAAVHRRFVNLYRERIAAVRRDGGADSAAMAG
jgi:hypothetical protein